MIALMLSLAMSAERAAGRSYAVRCFVLWVLRRAEAVVLRHVLRLDEATSPSAFTSLFRNSSTDALELAELFRLAAQALKGELRELRRFTRWWDRHEARLAHFSSPFEEGPGVGELALLRPAASLRESLQPLDHVILMRARIPSWAAINWPDTS